MNEFLLLAAAHFLATLSPGQDFVLLVRTSLRQGRQAGMVCAAGIAIANAIWIAAILIALEQARDIAPLMTGLRWLGGSFLIWLGWRFLRSRPVVGEQVRPSAPEQTGPAVWIGLISGLSNPKNGLFYASLFSFGVAVETSFSVRLLYGLWMVGVVLGWDILVALCLGHPKAQDMLKRWQHRIEQGAGAVLLAMGAAVILRA